MRYFSKLIYLLIVFPAICFSQNEFLDFGITKRGDTIYGTMRKTPLGKMVLYELKSQPGERGLKFKPYKLKKFDTFRYNDKIYKRNPFFQNDAIYTKRSLPEVSDDSLIRIQGDFINIQKRLPDYVVTKDNDTLFCKVKKSDLMLRDTYYTDSDGNKKKIKKDEIIAYRFQNDIYRLKERQKGLIFDKDGAYLKVILEGKINLYEYKYDQSGWSTNVDASGNNMPTRSSHTISTYVLESETDDLSIKDSVKEKRLIEFISDNEILKEKVLDEQYTLENLYLIIKYYNSYF